MKIDIDSLQVEEVNFVEPIDVMKVEITENPSSKVEGLNMLDYAEKVKVVYPNVEKGIIDFLNHYKIKGSEVMFFLGCSVVFGK